MASLDLPLRVANPPEKAPKIVPTQNPVVLPCQTAPGATHIEPGFLNNTDTFAK